MLLLTASQRSPLEWAKALFIWFLGLGFGHKVKKDTSSPKDGFGKEKRLKSLGSKAETTQQIKTLRAQSENHTNLKMDKNRKNEKKETLQDDGTTQN